MHESIRAAAEQSIITTYNLTTDSGLRDVCRLADPTKWHVLAPQWHRGLTEMLRAVRTANETERSTRAFQERLWEHNFVAAKGQCTINVDRALDNIAFRRWFACRSMEQLPRPFEERILFLSAWYADLRKQLEPFVKRMPHLKIFRVLAAMFPEAMTTVADRDKLRKLASAMGNEGAGDPIEHHLWVRTRLDSVLGDTRSDEGALACRMALPWWIYDRFVKS